MPAKRATVIPDKNNNLIYTSLRAELDKAGYNLLRVVKDEGEFAPEHQFEFWGGPKGVVILQLWKQGNGVHCYSNWGMGSSFEDFLKAINKQ